MHKTKRYEIDSCDDVELKIRRENKLEFNLDFDDEKPMRALLVFINGIRNADFAGYEAHLAEFAVREFEVAVLRVEYHCIGLRQQLGAAYCMDKRDKEIFANFCGQIVSLPENFTDERVLNESESAYFLQSIDNCVSQLKARGAIQQGFRATLSISIAPTKGEYNNFGVMQALDILNAICFVKNHAPFAFEKDAKTLLFGTSHGGYIAFLAAKFAPWLIDAVVENSAYVNAPLKLLGLGREFADFTKIHETSIEYLNNINLYITTKTHFTLDENSPNHYCEGYARIRDAADAAHLGIQSEFKKPIYISYHSVKDELQGAEFKLDFYEKLRNLGFLARLNLVQNQSEIDGKFIKNLTHGMGMSMKELILRELPQFLDFRGGGNLGSKVNLNLNSRENLNSSGENSSSKVNLSENSCGNSSVNLREKSAVNLGGNSS